MFTFLSRTAKYAFQDFWRNFWLSLITVTVVLLAMFSFNSLILVKTVSEFVLDTIEKRIDVSVFMNPGVDEASVLDLRERLRGLQEVKEVVYVSAEESLQAMIDRHQADPEIIQSLQELGGNPLGAQLIVKAQSPQDYPTILAVLEDDRYDAIISEQNLDQHAGIIERVATISERVRSIATAFTILFTLIALIVVFNTLRIIIYTHRDEIAIMRLVGATNWFIRFPYIWSSILYAVFALGIFVGVWYPILGFMQPYINELFVDNSTIDLVAFYNVNFIYLFGLQFLVLIMLLSVASILATRKYSRV